MQVNRVTQSQTSRYVQHYDPTDFIHQLKLTRRKKIKYPYIGRGYPGRRIVLIRFYSYKTLLQSSQDLLFVAVPVCAVICLKPMRVCFLKRISVSGRKLTAWRCHNYRGDLFPGKQVAVRLRKLIICLIRSYNRRPTDAPLFSFFACSLLPYMSMAVNEPVGQKIFKLFTVHPAVIFRYINDRHNNNSFRDSEFYFSIPDIVCIDTRYIPRHPLHFRDEHWQMKYQCPRPWRQ